MNSNQNAAPMQIALDGLLASGKSTVGAMLAEKLGCDFLDTGMMYRAVTYLTIKNRISTKDLDAVRDIAASSLTEKTLPPISTPTKSTSTSHPYPQSQPCDAP